METTFDIDKIFKGSPIGVYTGGVYLGCISMQGGVASFHYSGNSVLVVRQLFDIACKMDELEEGV